MRLLVTVLVALLVLPGAAFAHPPSDIDIQVAGNEVQITVAHQVVNPKTHYIKQIDITVNSQKMDRLEFTSQVDTSTQKVIYRIAALQPGDVIVVVAYCNRYGSREKAEIVR